jgi:hypothetical protein
MNELSAMLKKIWAKIELLGRFDRNDLENIAKSGRMGFPGRGLNLYLINNHHVMAGYGSKRLGCLMIFL